MKLQELILQDFRQFKGEQRINFATSFDRNVTLVFGANGSGKTTLLNAFTWVLYDLLSPDFEQKGRLINKETWDQAEEGSQLKVMVTLTFEHDGEKYEARRWADAIKSGEQAITSSTLELRKIGLDGASEEVPAPQDRISQLVPKDLSSFFFFNGERMEHLVRREAVSEIELAIKTLLGLEIVERGIKHVKGARTTLVRELAEFGGDEFRELQQQIDETENDLEQLHEKDRMAAAEWRAAKDQVEEIEEALRATAATRELQIRRDDLVGQNKASEGRKEAAWNELRGVLNDSGFLAFVPGLFQTARTAAEALRARGHLPAPLKKQFVDDLLESGVCICERPLEPGDAAHACVMNWRERAGAAEVEAAWASIGASIRESVGLREELQTRLQELRARISEEEASQRTNAALLSEIESQLGNFDSEAVQRLEAERRHWEKRAEESTHEQGRIKERIDALKKTKAHLEAEQERAELADKRAAVAKRRSEVADEVRELLMAIFDVRKQAVRSELDKRIRETYRDITFKKTQPELSEAFELQLWEIDGDTKNPAARGTGENQILSLSFIGALASYAREQAEAGDSFLGRQGTVFPIVMDAAFGALDNNYRKEIARALPKLAPQVIVLVSKSQGQGPVENEMRPFVGEQSVIAYHSPKESDSNETIEIDGRSHPYILTGTEVELAEIVEVS